MSNTSYDNVTNLKALDITLMGHTIAGLGYNNPSDDSDQRQVEMFNYIYNVLVREHGFKVELKKEVEDLSNLVKNKGEQAKIYKYLQPRSDREGKDVESLVSELYVDGKRRERIPFCLNYGNIFPLSGNKRMKAHYIALHKSGELDFELEEKGSLCDYLEITPPEGMTDKQIVRLTKRLARKSNSSSVTQTRELTVDDREHELRGEYEVEWEHLNLSRDELISRAKDFFAEEDYNPTPGVLGDLVNRVLQEKRGHVADAKSLEEIKAMYSDFFPSEEWITSAQDNYFCSVKASSTFEKIHVPCMDTSGYMKSDGKPSIRSTLNFCITRGIKMTNIDSIAKDEKSIIESATKYNLNQVAIETNHPLIERLMFPAHIIHQDDTDTAYLWSKSKKMFIKQSRNSN